MLLLGTAWRSLTIAVWPHADDRLSIITGSPAVVQLFQADFETVWYEAQDIST